MFHPHSKEDLEPLLVMVFQHQSGKALQEECIQAITCDALQSLNVAQETELIKIAHELHDDICQRLALLSLRIEKTTNDWVKGKKEVGEQLEQIWQQCSALTGDVHALSHALHPSILDNLGLVRAARGFCREIADRRGVVVDFTHSKVPDSLSREISLSLFRLLQESLHNAVKSAGEHHFQVLMKGDASGIQLEIGDQGVGFDMEKVWSKSGAGLISMRERIQLLNGTLQIHSKSNVGTRISVWIPLSDNSKTLARAAN